MSLEITGKLIQLMPLETGEGRNGPWKKQTFIIEYMDGSYAKKVHMVVWGDKMNVLSGIREGAELKVSFNAESREYNQRWYTDLKAWKIEVLNPTTGQEDFPDIPSVSNSIGSADESSENDLPF